MRFFGTTDKNLKFHDNVQYKISYVCNQMEVTGDKH